MIIFIHPKNDVSNYFRDETGGTFIQKSPHILSNATALFSLFLEYA